MTTGGGNSPETMRPEQGAGHIGPGEYPLIPDNTASGNRHDHDDPLSSGAVIIPKFMPMTRSEFCATDLSTATPAERAQYLRMKVRILRDRNESEEAKAYFDTIEAAYEASFTEVTPEMLADPKQMNLVRCVDPYTDKQLDELDQFPPEQQRKLPGGLGWFDVTGQMYDWVVPRIFNPELAAGMHRNCGGFAIIGALTGERQAAARQQAEQNAKRITLEVAAVIRQEYLRRKGHNFDPEGAEVLANFGGPRLTFATGEVGTAEGFITPKAPPLLHVEESYTPRELVEGVDGWINERLKTTATENA